ncbi:MAG TPA: cupin domain-containing protein [Caulobacteraceae bacterium]|nr:cupin domain-containing protein [Caulobacteraceae bacterium]
MPGCRRWASSTTMWSAASAAGPDEMATAQEIVARLDLRPHPEGGWYRQTWRAPFPLRAAGAQARPSCSCWRPGSVRTGAGSTGLPS